MSRPSRYELTDHQLQRLEGLLPGKASDPRRSGADNRAFVNGVLWVLRSGARWSDLPERYGKYKTLHKRFTRWAAAGIWEQGFAVLGGQSIPADRQHHCSCAPALRPEKGGNPALMRSRGGLSTKIHMASDGHGRPLRLILTPGHVNDITHAPALLKSIKPTQVLAGKGYDSRALVA